MAREISRRSFLAGAAVAGAAIAGTGLVGCASGAGEAAGAAAEGASTVTEVNPSLWGPSLVSTDGIDVASEETTDVVVCGSGTAGTYAAIRLAESGANVIWLEKTGLKGGTSNITEACAVPNTKLQKAAGDAESDTLAIHDVIQTWHHWGAIDEAIWSHFERGAEAIDWACEHGAKYQYLGPAQSPTIMCFGEDGKWISMGEGVLKPLWEYGETFENLDFRLETPMVNLVVEDGKVCGVYAQSADGIVKISASAVICATGGYGRNDAMLANYLCVDPSRVKLLGLDGQEGDGINVALQAGATLHAPNALMYGLTHVIDSEWDDIMNIGLLWPAGMTMMPIGESLFVNEKAQRYFNEGIKSMANSTPLNIATAAQAKTFAIFDEDRVKGYDGMEEFDYFTGISHGNLREHIEGCEYIVKADTIEELAGMVGLDPEVLAQTVAEFNAAAEGGQDGAFGADGSLLAPIKTAPFYAAEIEACAYSTAGGIKTNYDCQAIGADGNPIEGLYLCGLDNGSLYYNDYPYGVYSGSGQGSALSNGFAAAEAVKASLGLK